MARPAGPISKSVLRALARSSAALTGTRRGIEKESLRVGSDGALSSRPHPACLGSALTHPTITTDFSEAQLELITGVHASPEDAIGQLDAIHRFVYQCLDDEFLWVSSMPCHLPPDDQIPVGQYGSSNAARIKTVYRLGLGNRYGRFMQTISGIHYNFSVDDAFWQVLADTLGETDDQRFRTRRYFGLIRNFRRYSWLLIYLFGASPALCRSFVAGKPHTLQSFDEHSLYLPHATSLRMGRLGYQSDAQSALHISYNSLEDYARSMQEALTRPYPAYQALGIEVDGEYRQLNDTLLQIENEFYGTIRPKRPVRDQERPLAALRRRGVDYVEVRCLDLNPFLPVGIDEVQIRFLDTFLLYCLLADSPDDSPAESAMMSANQLAIVEHGRAPDLMLAQAGGTVRRQDWAAEILAGCRPLADLLDQAHATEAYGHAWAEQERRVLDPELTPSAQILGIMRQQALPFFRFALNQSIAHKGYFDSHQLAETQLADCRAEAHASIARQRAIEAADTVDFATYLKRYLALEAD